MDLFILAFMVFAVSVVALMGAVFWYSIPKRTIVVLLDQDDDDDPGGSVETPDNPKPEGDLVDWETFDKARNIWSTHTFSN